MKPYYESTTRDAAEIEADRMHVDGEPLFDLGLDQTEIVDSEGRVVGQLTGLVVLDGETIQDAIVRLLPSGCSLRAKLPR